MEQSDNTCNRDSFDPIPKLKSSPVPILFVPFNQDDENCFNCGNKYFKPLLIQQKYCENCLSKYVTSITDNEMYLDVHISTKDVHCKEHETSRDKNFCTLKIQEWCKNCSIISWFKQIVSHPLIPHFYAIDIEKQNKVIEIEEDCKLCGKLIQRFSEFYKFRICSDCYHISSGWIKSAYKKYIPILYLPWWDTANKCMTCGNLNLIFSSNSQKWCPSCYTLYAGCRYCLTTNIIFGLTYQSQCRKCERIIYISSDILKSSSGHDDIDEFLHCVRINIKTIHKIANYEDNINKDHNLLNVYELMTCVVFRLELSIQWIPYSQITILNEIAKGGYSIVYKAIWSHSESMYKSYYYEYNRGELQVALKKFLNSRDVKKYFLNELKSHYVHNYCGNIILCYGVTMDPATNDYMLVMQYANGGTLHNYLQIHFSAITWKEKIWIIYRISDGLRIIHAANFVHRDFHSGNILYTNSKYEVIYADLGEHAKRPEITEDTPEFLANLMKRCWDSDPKNRPTAWEIKNSIYSDSAWKFSNYEALRLQEAEQKRLELIRLKKLGPEFIEKPHSKAIYTSRPLSSLYTNSSNSLIKSLFSVNSLNTKQGYISREYEFDIKGSQSSSLTDIKSSLSRANIKGSKNNKKYDSKELEFDIDEIQSLSSQSKYSTIKKFFFRKAKQKA
ncbi:uncharacterized protein OCT59_003079 [Rhizophagus irregularis]|uniref:uncharacterized protein n=1 Tax=Rhizophagus irregularis TaxID=588596 RepID=UPI001A05CC88|nr:hypothetical protein OCT59_003079 [Rhizophagus irregularis]GBC36869.2 kinase-like domain-containing protein [Rhizophagus irregularis DAOM 181602=DAOM 197198]